MATRSNAAELRYKEAAALGAVQGITEFLPVSSTGHMIVAHEVFSDKGPQALEQKSLIDKYLVVVQLGSICALLWVYFGRIKSILRGFLGRDWRGLKLGVLLITAFVPTGIAGLLLDGWIQTALYSTKTVAITLILGGVLIWFSEKYKTHSRKNVDALTFKNALTIGFFQCIALIPGTSRSLMTILAGYWVGLSRVEAVTFSFLLGLLTSSTATAYKILKEGPSLLSLSFGPTFLGCTIAFILSLLTARWLLTYIQHHTLIPFAYYRILFGLMLFLFL
ncbi:MAG: hypothetical protein A2Y14_05855 [Verrucomicrobia bacterium GWF2_51_19]|nr:MAG: hypothetical protein A2Y14_05855 [Verrucomicrobia bacterium GWF2_51_19]